MFETLINQPLIDAATAGLLAVMIGTLRLLPILFIFPPFTLAAMTIGLLRGGILAGFALFYLPFTLPIVTDLQAQGTVFDTMLWLIPKEIFIGILIAVLMSLPFWAAFSGGALIDTQAGQQMQGLLSPGTGEESTASATFFQLIMLAIVLEAGLFTMLVVTILPTSFASWPIPAPLPELDAETYKLILSIIGLIFHMALIIVAPILGGLFMIDVTFGFLSRFVPSINPFFLSLGAKSLFMCVFVVVYHQFMVEYLADTLNILNVLSPNFRQ